MVRRSPFWSVNSIRIPTQDGGTTAHAQPLAVRNKMAPFRQHTLNEKMQTSWYVFVTVLVSVSSAFSVCIHLWCAICGSSSESAGCANCLARQNIFS